MDQSSAHLFPWIVLIKEGRDVRILKLILLLRFHDGDLVCFRMRLPQLAVCLLLLGTQGVRAMGDRFAWSPPEEVEERGSKEIAGAEGEQVVRTVRKTEELGEQVEGRFVGKEVLCSLGLADVSGEGDDDLDNAERNDSIDHDGPNEAIVDYNLDDIDCNIDLDTHNAVEDYSNLTLVFQCTPKLSDSIQYVQPVKVGGDLTVQETKQLS